MRIHQLLNLAALGFASCEKEMKPQESIEPNTTSAATAICDYNLDPTLIQTGAMQVDYVKVFTSN